MENTHSHQQQEWIDDFLPSEEEYFHKTEKVYQAKGKDVLNLVKDILKMANVVRITVWHKEKALASLPVVYGGVMAAVFPYLSAFAMISLLALDCKIIVEKK